MYKMGVATMKIVLTADMTAIMGEQDVYIGQLTVVTMTVKLACVNTEYLSTYSAIINSL